MALTVNEIERFYSATQEPRLQAHIATAEVNGGFVTLRTPDIDPSLPTIFAVMGPSAVGKTAIVSELVGDGSVIQLQTASERPLRPGERRPMTESFPPRLPGESRKDYCDRLNNELTANFIGISIIDDYLYGLPARELTKLTPDKPHILLSRPDAVISVEEALREQANIVRVGIMPDSYKQLIGRIAEQRTTGDRLMSLWDMVMAFEMGHILVHNRAAADGVPVNEAIKRSALVFRKMINQVL